MRANLGAKRSMPNYQNTYFEASCNKRMRSGRFTLAIDLAKDNALLGISINDIQAIKTARVINNCKNDDNLSRFKNTEKIEELKTVRNKLNCAINRLQSQDDIEITHTPPDSPVALGNVSMTTKSEDSLVELNQGFKESDKNVVNGKGVVATCDFKKGDEIAAYEGDIACRIFCDELKNKFYAFTIREENGDFEIKGLEKDTFVAWSQVTVRKSGKYAIELGRNGSTDLRYLNHSKNANVEVAYVGRRQLSWSDRNSLRLTATALRKIHKGEELLFDYNPDKTDSEIDFSISLIEKLTDSRKKAIYKQIQKLQDNTHRKVLEKEVILPKVLDEPVGEIMQLLYDFRVKESRPATIGELFNKLSNVHKNILRIFFATDEPDLNDLKNQLGNPNKTGKFDSEINQLTTKNTADLKKYFLKSIFNGENSWIEPEELKNKFQNQTSKIPGQNELIRPGVIRVLQK
ncbi:SET domain-containing protein-lysine N-methyltransferase [Endozoicomonas sp.]|uniref:SET domain-containing protein-lysine N-methyltransferase n=1 Tax=Endozoicomonas sp. TaxID=1892382 RepID=UPI0028863AF3|nr:SET domain-containing protein [Endozoicomonas sp.]